MSSQDLIFAPGEGLKRRMNVEIVLDWPRLRDDWIHLELVLKVTITSNQDGVVEARIVTYVFRTRQAAEASFRTEPAGMGCSCSAVSSAKARLSTHLRNTHTP